MLNEELLSVWLQLGNVIDNQRLVSTLPFNEAVVCGLLYRSQQIGTPMTASDLCSETRILKSQMHASLHSLEKKGFLQRRRSQADLRQVQLQLLPEGIQVYLDSHRQTLALVDRLIDCVGSDSIQVLIPLLRQVVEKFDSLLKEV